MDLENILFESADVDVTVTKEETNVTAKENVMQRLARYEELELAKNKVLEVKEAASLKEAEILAELSNSNEEYKEALSSLNNAESELAAIALEEEQLKEEILSYQRDAYGDDENNKSLNYNCVYSTYVLPTEKNQFDLKKFREDQTEFWEANQSTFAPYAKITPVADYVKITIK